MAGHGFQDMVFQGVYALSTRGVLDVSGSVISFQYFALSTIVNSQVRKVAVLEVEQCGRHCFHRWRGSEWTPASKISPP